jgi:hypothetical protein
MDEKGFAAEANAFRSGNDDRPQGNIAMEQFDVPRSMSMIAMRCS